MRVADRTSARNYLKYLNKAKNDYAETNERIASGKRFTKLSDDVSAGSRVLQARAEKYKVEKQLDNVHVANEEMASAEDAMSAISDILSKVHNEKVQKAKNETTGDSGRQTISNEIKMLKKEILQFANTRYGKNYVFGGTNAYAAPFTESKDGKLLYNNVDVDLIQKREDGSYFYTEGGEEIDVPMNEEVYMDIGLGIKMYGKAPDPNTAFSISYSGLNIMGWGTDKNGNSNNIFNIISQIEKNINDYHPDALAKWDDKLSSQIDSFRTSITDIGAKTSFLETMESRLKTNVDSYTTKISGLMGINDAEEATNQTMNDYVLKAVLQMGSRILPTSLMDFLR